MSTKHTPISEVILKARNCGYLCRDFTKVKIEYTFDIIPNDVLVELLGDKLEVVNFSKFEVENLEDFVTEFFNHKDNKNSSRPCSIDEIRDCVISHFKEQVAKYLKTGDTLKQGAGMLGARQMVYVEDSEAWREELRLEQWQHDRSAAFRAERAKSEAV